MVIAETRCDAIAPSGAQFSRLETRKKKTDIAQWIFEYSTNILLNQNIPMKYVPGNLSYCLKTYRYLDGVGTYHKLSPSIVIESYNKLRMNNDEKKTRGKTYRYVPKRYFRFSNANEIYLVVQYTIGIHVIILNDPNPTPRRPDRTFIVDRIHNILYIHSTRPAQDDDRDRHAAMGSVLLTNYIRNQIS